MHRLVGYSKIEAKFLGYHFMQAPSFDKFVEMGGFSQLNAVYPPLRCENSLPLNFTSRQELFQEELWGRSFYQIPDRVVDKAFIATVDFCKIVSRYDQFDNEYSVVLNSKNIVVPLRGIGFDSRHRTMLNSCKEKTHVEEAAWIFENWSGNYYHWLIYHLPKVLLLKEFSKNIKILTPEKNKLYPVIYQSLKMMGYDNSQLINIKQGITCVDRLTVVNLDHHDPRLLKRLSEVFRSNINKASDSNGDLVYISRKKSHWRRITNENAIISFLEKKRFKILLMEDLDFEEQVAMAHGARLVVSAHGAGLANMLFCKSGVDVIEIVNPNFPNSDYYSLACGLGLKYWMLKGEGVGTQEPAYQDIVVCMESFKELLKCILGTAE